MAQPSKRRVLFLCTGNSCRSQMAEAILRHAGGNAFEAFSAGSHPAGYVHALAIQALRELDIPIHNFVSKSWHEYAKRSFDLVITVCDAAAGEPCPSFPGGPIRAHWSLPDPVGKPGTDEERLDFAVTIARRLQAKIEAVTNLDWTLPRTEIEAQLADLARL